MQDQQKPPSFPNLPKSALFSKLEAFLPVMAEENKKLSDAVAAGEGAKHSIEVEDDEEQSDEDGDDAMTGGDEKEKKPPVIEMNFALGMMDENNSDAEDAGEIDPEARIMAATTTKTVESDSKQQEKDSSFQMRLEKPSNKPRPVIQELN
ncbi:hypothetical protein PHPALM_12663 [Phytophthora palmivora]|uniref:Uncharacterized protein n=1 Tax=Phytophthora palmivora TaxID=4796 RepID=A0A2P4XZ61_9STRA|nr:hypothetical protein PHPALM_12663 [Phytophthora palmivora]